MQECQPIPTIRAFFDSRLSYVLPAPGGALADAGPKTNQPCDLYLAALAAKAKKRLGTKRNPLEYLGMHFSIVRESTLFDTATDARILSRIGSWMNELCN